VGLPLQLRVSSVIQMGPGHLLGGMRPESVGSTWVEGSVVLYEDLLQIFRPIYMLY
jgi:hypothetical protein